MNSGEYGGRKTGRYVTPRDELALEKMWFNSHLECVVELSHTHKQPLG